MSAHPFRVCLSEVSMKPVAARSVVLLAAILTGSCGGRTMAPGTSGESTTGSLSQATTGTGTVEVAAGASGAAGATSGGTGAGASPTGASGSTMSASGTLASSGSVASGATATSGVSTTGNPGGAPFCSGGCLCFSTPETCPSDCVQIRRADGTFICGYASPAGCSTCNCIYHPDDGGIYVCDNSSSWRACPSTGAPTCNQGPCMSCDTSLGPETCGCVDFGPKSSQRDAAPQWSCVGTEQTCKGP
jgi:hypothetical protein